jgi:hypothetical protein
MNSNLMRVMIVKPPANDPFAADNDPIDPYSPNLRMVRDEDVAMEDDWPQRFDAMTGIICGVILGAMLWAVLILVLWNM